MWRERKPTEARQQLDQALVGFQPMAHHDLVEGLVLFTKSYLCAVHGELGDLPAARKLFNEVKKFLTAHREEELLKACRAKVLDHR